MAVKSTKCNAVTGIITGGLGLPACKGMIVNNFRVGLCIVEVIERPVGGGGGSTAIGTAVRPDYINDTDYTPVEPTREVIIRVRFDKDSIKFTRNYTVKPRTGKVIIKALSTTAFVIDKVKIAVTNITSSKGFRAVATNVRSGIDTIRVKIKNLRDK